MSPLTSMTLRLPLPTTVVAFLTLLRVCVAVRAVASEAAVSASASAWVSKAALVTTLPTWPCPWTWPFANSSKVPLTVPCPEVDTHAAQTRLRYP